MPYKYIEDVAIADMAFEAEGKTLNELFEAAALAVTNTMVKNLDGIRHRSVKEIQLKAADAEMLLFNFLQELIYYKDAEQLLFSKFHVSIEPADDGYALESKAYGEQLDTKRHISLVDVKAVTMHQFEIKPSRGGWKARVILDV